MAITTRKDYFKNKTKQNLLNRSEYGIQDRKIANNLIEEKASISLNNVIHLAGVTTKVDYYYQDVKDNSEVDNNPVNQTSDNLTMYGCVRDLPLRFNEELSISDEGDEVLRSFVYSGSAIVLPNTILPKPNDYFSLYFNNRRMLYRVEEVTMESTVENPGRMIQFHLDSTYGRDFDFDNWPLKKNIRTNKIFISKHLGTDFKPIIDECEIETLEYVVELHDALANIYIRNFYDDKVNSFFLKYKNFDFDNLTYVKVNDEGDEEMPEGIYRLKWNQTFYDSLMIQFLKTNCVFNRHNGYVLSPTHLMDVDFDDYDNSIFKAVEDQDISRFNNKYFKTKCLDKISVFQSPALYQKYILSHTATKINIGGYDFYPMGFIDTMFKTSFDDVAETTYNSPSELISEIISLWVNKGDEKEIIKRLRLLREFKDALVLSNIYPNNAFYTYPLVAYIANKVMEKTFKNNNFRETKM